MEGARQRRVAERILMAEVNWMAVHADQSEITSWIAQQGDGPVNHPPEALDRMLRSTSAGMREISLDDYLAAKRRMQ